MNVNMNSNICSKCCKSFKYPYLLKSFGKVKLFTASGGDQTTTTFTVNGTRVVSNRYASNTAVLLVDVFVNAPEL